MEAQKHWWKEIVIYQIYPRSYKDSTGDGIGDIPGIISKLDYIKDLGIDVIWLSPVYDSPNDDNGYDIRNYYTIHEDFGTMQDFDALLEGVHARGMKLIMDLVVNHSSDEHQWFEASKQSKDNEFRDYYIWKKGKNGGPPNNWRSFFGGSAWQHDPATDEYYLHLFTKKQPDLNWENPKVRNGVYDILRFWLDKGIDGFRMDVIPLISKRLEFADSTLSSFNEEVEKIYSNGPRVHEFINEMYEEVLKHYDIFTVGEGPGINKDVGIKYVGHDRNELNMIFHLDHMFLGHGPKGKFDPVPYGWKEVKQLFREWDDAMGDSGWISIFMDNHDFPRMVSRFGNDQEFRVESAKLLATMILTLRGTPCIYQGSELGMTNVKFNSIHQYRDVETINFHKELDYLGMDEKRFLALVHENGRDNVRTPMQWDSTKNAGFSPGTPWIDVNPNYKNINYSNIAEDQNSIFAFYKEILNYRKANQVLVYGSFIEIPHTPENIFAYNRKSVNGNLLIVLNHSDNHEVITFDIDGYQLEIQNVDNTMEKVLLPWEARIYRHEA